MRLPPSVIFALLAAFPAAAQTYTAGTFAGGALPEKVAGRSASLGNLYGVALDSSGNLYLSLADYDVVLRLDANTAMLTRIAGNGTAGFSGDGGPATSAQLSGPTGLAIDAANNLYIADSNNYRIRVVSNGIISTVAGTGTAGYSGDNGPATAAEFNGVADLAMDSAGNLYVADFYNQAVRRISGGTVTTIAGTGVYGYNGDGIPAAGAQLGGPSGIAIDSAGNLYVAEVYNNRIRKISGGVINTVAGNGTAGFSGDTKAATAATLRQPSAVSVDAAGTLYIADFGNYRIRAVSGGLINTVAGNGTAAYNGEYVSATAAGLPAPRRVAAGAPGTFLIADGIRVREVSGGTVVTVAGGGAPAGENGPATSAQLQSPNGLAADAAGNLYISDSGNGRVLKVAGGTLTRVAGGGSLAPGADGVTATGAQLLSPTGVAVNGSGDLFIADSQTARLQKVSNGLMTTMAGGGAVFGDGGSAVKAQLSAPQGVALDAAGNLYAADLNRVRMVSSGTISTAVGNGSGGFQGDGGPATAAYLASPNGLAVDASGTLYLADSGNNRVRAVAGGTISTVVGNGNYGASGSGGTATSAALATPAGVATDSAGNLYLTDAYRVLKVSKGKISTIAGFRGPQGIAVDAAGDVFVADPASHSVRILTPAGSVCNTTASPTSPQAPASGGSLALAVQTGASCSWTIESLPGWITVSGAPFGAGPATATLEVASNSGPPRSATIVAGGQNVTVFQAGAMTVVGQVVLPSGTPLAGVTVTLGGGQSATVTTDSGGNFSFSGLASSATYTVTPAFSGYSFVPANATVSNPSSNPSLAFTAWPAPQVAALTPVFISQIQPAPARFAAGEIVAIWGSNLCSTPASAAPTLPDRLAACIVQVDGVNVRLQYASATQVNAVLPQALAPGAHQLVVQRYTDTAYKTPAAQSLPYSLTVDKVSMAFVERAENANQMLVVQYLDGGLAGSARPLHPGDTVTLYLTGLGRTVQTFAEGAAPRTTSSAAEPIQIQVQGMPAQILYAGTTAGFPGFDQINARLPGYALPAGGSTVTIQIAAPSSGQTLNYQVPSN